MAGALEAAGSSDLGVGGDASDGVLMNWFEQYVEQVMGALAMQLEDASRIISLALVVEGETPGRTVSSVTTSGIAATPVCSSMPVSKQRVGASVTTAAWDTTEAAVGVAVEGEVAWSTLGEAMAGSPPCAALNSDQMLSSCADSCARNHRI